MALLTGLAIVCASVNVLGRTNDTGDRRAGRSVTWNRVSRGGVVEHFPHEETENTVHPPLSVLLAICPDRWSGTG